MKPLPRSRPLPQSRRAFLRRNLFSAGLLGLVGTVAASRRLARAAGSPDVNPFAYDVGKFETTDPKLIAYRELARFPSPRPSPRRLALAADGSLLVAADKAVVRVDRSGAVLGEIALETPVRCVAAAADGLIYAGLRDHLEVFDAKGQRKASWPAPGPKSWLSGIAVNEAEVFVADAGSRVVLRYDRAGKLAGRIGERNADRNVPGFILPSPFLDVELHRDGLLRINNPGRHRVEAYTRDGEFELAWGKPTAGIDGFCGCCNPINLAVLPDGRLITCEKGLPRVKVYNLQGEFESVVAGPESFKENARVGAGETTGDGVKAGLDAVADAQGRIYILDFVAADIRVMAPKTGAV